MSTRVRWLGHSALLLESDGRTLLIDPFPDRESQAASDAGDVPADLILISHGHGDHVGDAIAIADAPERRSRPTLRSPNGSSSRLKALTPPRSTAFNMAAASSLTKP